MINIFWDWDNSLAHTLEAGDESHADHLLDMYGEYWRGVKYCLDDGWYVTFKRTWADEAVKFSRDLVGLNNVNILTTGTRDYICACNNALDMGFDPTETIFSREDILSYGIHPKFKNHYNILLDNESYDYHNIGDRCKVSFLDNICPKQYIQIDNFTVWSETIKPSNYLEVVKHQLVSCRGGYAE